MIYELTDEDVASLINALQAKPEAEAEDWDTLIEKLEELRCRE